MLENIKIKINIGKKMVKSREINIIWSIFETVIYLTNTSLTINQTIISLIRHCLDRTFAGKTFAPKKFLAIYFYIGFIKNVIGFSHFLTLIALFDLIYGKGNNSGIKCKSIKSFDRSFY